MLFRKQINMLRELNSEILDPKSMMDTILNLKEGVVVEFTRYRRADKNPAFRQELLNEIC